MAPRWDAATLTLEAGSKVDIDDLHRILGHPGEESLRLTAKAREIELKGKLEACEFCKVSNSRQKDVPKVTRSPVTEPGQEIGLDISYVDML